MEKILGRKGEDLGAKRKALGGKGGGQGRNRERGGKDLRDERAKI